ncbi:hypothetical protein H0H92_015407 [Tricholoma furcatifolium]|nr:hypothetical protein H0H92_015407 [Tricholoma furcatifolium]
MTTPALPTSAQRLSTALLSLDAASIASTTLIPRAMTPEFRFCIQHPPSLPPTLTPSPTTTRQVLRPTLSPLDSRPQTLATRPRTLTPSLQHEAAHSITNNKTDVDLRQDETADQDPLRMKDASTRLPLPGVTWATENAPEISHPPLKTAQPLVCEHKPNDDDTKVIAASNPHDGPPRRARPISAIETSNSKSNSDPTGSRRDGRRAVSLSVPAADARASASTQADPTHATTHRSPPPPPSPTTANPNPTSAPASPSSPSRSRASFIDRLKGEMKIISGKLSRDDAMAQEGRRLIAMGRAGVKGKAREDDAEPEPDGVQ